MNITKPLLVLLTIPLIALANKVEKVEINPNSPDVNTELSVKLNFTTPDDKVQCGIGIDWGDGDKQKLRVGNGQQVTPPFVLTHIYKSAGQKQIVVKGEFIARGLNSISGCDVNVSGSITVQDPAVRAEKERVEKERQAELEKQTQLIAQKAKEREEYLASPAGKKDFENFQKNITQLLGKPLAMNCNSNQEIVWILKGEGARLSKKLNYSEQESVSEEVISSSEYLGKDLLSIKYKNESGTRTVEYKINQKYIQVYNDGDFVKNGVTSSGGAQPVINVCPTNSTASKIVANEISGASAKTRERQAVQDAENRAQQKLANFKSKNYQAMFFCDTQKSGNESASEGLADNMLRTIAFTPNLYLQMITQSDDCKMTEGSKFANYELLEEKGQVKYKANGKAFILLKVSKFRTIGIVGKE
jgi:hypothetical protein